MMTISSRNRAKLQKHSSVVSSINAQDEVRFARAAKLTEDIQAEIQGIRHKIRPFGIDKKVTCGEVQLFNEYCRRLHSILVARNNQLALAKVELELAHKALLISTSRKVALEKICK